MQQDQEARCPRICLEVWNPESFLSESPEIEEEERTTTANIPAKMLDDYVGTVVVAERYHAGFAFMADSAIGLHSQLKELEKQCKKTGAVAIAKTISNLRTVMKANQASTKQIQDSADKITEDLLFGTVILEHGPNYGTELVEEWALKGVENVAGQYGDEAMHVDIAGMGVGSKGKGKA